MKDKQLFSSEKDNWRTPGFFWSKLDQRFNFWIDLAADKENTKCLMYLTKEDNALSKPWAEMQKLYEPETLTRFGWCNPPYGSAVKKFLQKAAEENVLGFRSVFLVASRTDTEAFQKYIFDQAEEVYFIDGRLTFVDETGKPATNGATFPSLVAVYTGMQAKTKFYRMDRLGNIIS